MHDRVQVRRGGGGPEARRYLRQVARPGQSLLAASVGAKNQDLSPTFIAILHLD